MKKRIFTAVRKGAATSVLFAALLPVFALAQSQTLNNPVSGVNNVQGFIQKFLEAVVEIALPILTLFIVYAGFKFVMARGNPSELAKAKANFVWVIVGAIFILGAWVLATLIGGTVSQVVGTS